MKNNSKSIDLILSGQNNIALAERSMGALMEIRRRFKKEKPFKGLKIGMALHVTKETAVLVRTLRDGGAMVEITGCNPLSTQDDVAQALRSEGVSVYGYKGETVKVYHEFIHKVAMAKPDIVIDDGCDLISVIHEKYPKHLDKMIGGCEETTTGIVRLRSMEKAGALKIPVIAVNDNKTKHLMDNYYGTGQSTLDGILRATNTLVAGKIVVVAGYGSCGKGVAMRMRGHGANVIVTEVDYFCALQAVMDGFRVMPMGEACTLGDIFVTVTGDIHVIRMEHMKKMKNGAILCNSGHFDHEIDMTSLKKASKKVKRVRVSMDEYIIGSKSLFVLGEGRLVNLAAAEGHPSEVMSMSFCGQALACEYLVKNAVKKEAKGGVISRLPAGVHTLPPEFDDLIASLQLKSMGIRIDTLTSEQKKYLAGWQSGT